jgi:hypothetical protein
MSHVSYMHESCLLHESCHFILLLPILLLLIHPVSSSYFFCEQVRRGRDAWSHVLGQSAPDMAASEAFYTAERVVYQWWTEAKPKKEWQEGADDTLEDPGVRRYCQNNVTFMQLHNLTMLSGIYTGTTKGTGGARGRGGHFLKLPLWGAERKDGGCEDWKTKRPGGSYYQLSRKICNRFGLPVKAEIAYQGTADGTKDERMIAEWIVFAMTHRASLPGVARVTQPLLHMLPRSTRLTRSSTVLHIPDDSTLSLTVYLSLPLHRYLYVCLHS